MNVFSRIYRENLWNGIETRSGPGSHREPTRRVSEALTDITHWLGIFSVTDVGCGEGSWFPDIAGIIYTGIDVAPEAIEVARSNHPDRYYMEWDARTSFGRSDMVVCRDVIQHLSLKDGQRLLLRIRQSHSPWLLASTYIDGTNENIRNGSAYRPNLNLHPFDLPPALILIHDGYEYHDGDRLRDPGKMLGLWRL